MAVIVSYGDGGNLTAASYGGWPEKTEWPDS